jgi:Zn-dependent peptidase ImmA (M78 family)/DNA-binding XRE family transcriptional regulator
MTNRIEALVKPELLVWARESSRLDLFQAAQKIGIDSEKLKQWEDGAAKPSIPQLRKIAGVYKRPLAVFYLTEPPKTFDAMHDFRRLPDGSLVVLSPELAFEIRRARHRREIAIELSEQQEETITSLNLKIDINKSLDETAKEIRDFLGINLNDQFRWENKYIALNAWKNALEQKGVLVFQTERVSQEQMRGMSFSEQIYPVIILNGQDSPRGKIFTLIHEFTHVLLNDGGICNFNEFGATKDIEVYCNYITGEVLVPTDSLESDRIILGHNKKLDWDDEEISDLANRYWVSQEVILRRLVITGKVSEDFYKKKRLEYLDSYIEQRKQEKERMKENSGHPPHFRMVMRKNGLRYTRIVLNAYYDDLITASEVSDYLDTKLKHLTAIEQAVISSDTGEMFQ